MTGPHPPRRTGVADERGDEGLAMIFVMMFMLLVGTLSLTVLSQLTSEVRQTGFARKHAQTVNSALAGLNAGLNQIRSSTNSSGAGVRAQLPCTVGSNRGTISGPVDADGLYTYSVDIFYLSSDPSALTETQVRAAAMTCPPTAVPGYAYLLATGSQAALPGSSTGYGNRTIHAVYDFATDNTANKGGQILTANSLCWDAGSSPAVGSPITLRACLAAGTASQSWYFRPDLSIQWVGNTSANLCLDYRGVAVIPRDSLMTLQTCLGSGVAGTAYDTLNQVYSPAGKRYQEFALGTWLKDVSASGDAAVTNCMVSYTPNTLLYEQRLVGDRMAMSPVCSSASYAVFGNTTGAGGAGGVTNGLPSISEQLVNYKNTQDCLDVSGSVPSRGLIHFPCHQAPDPGKVEGNQRFQYTGTTTTPGPITTTRTDNPVFNYSTVCMESNGSATALLRSCVDGKAEQQWQLTGYRAGDYAGSYLIVDYTGKCLTSTSGLTTQLLICNGSDAQKWNAPPGGVPSELTSVGER